MAKHDIVWMERLNRLLKLLQGGRNNTTTTPVIDFQMRPVAIKELCKWYAILNSLHDHNNQISNDAFAEDELGSESGVRYVRFGCRVL